MFPHMPKEYSITVNNLVNALFIIVCLTVKVNIIEIVKKTLETTHFHILLPGTTTITYNGSGNNQTANVFAAKFDWSASETRFYNTAINFAS